VGRANLTLGNGHHHVNRDQHLDHVNPNADNTNQSKICPNCGQENDRYGLPIYPFNKSTKVLNWCTKYLVTVNDITTVDRELPQADSV